MNSPAVTTRRDVLDWCPGDTGPVPMTEELPADPGFALVSRLNPERVSLHLTLWHSGVSHCEDTRVQQREPMAGSPVVIS